MFRRKRRYKLLNLYVGKKHGLKRASAQLTSEGRNRGRIKGCRKVGRIGLWESSIHLFLLFLFSLRHKTVSSKRGRGVEVFEHCRKIGKGVK